MRSGSRLDTLELSGEQLRAFDGTNPAGRIFISVRGTIYDVSDKGRDFYGPGASTAVSSPYKFRLIIRLIPLYCVDQRLPSQSCSNGAGACGAAMAEEHRHKATASGCNQTHAAALETCEKGWIVWHLMHECVGRGPMLTRTNAHTHVQALDITCSPGEKLRGPWRSCPCARRTAAATCRA